MLAGRFEMAPRGTDYPHTIFNGHELFALCLAIRFRASQARQDQSDLARDQVGTVKLKDNGHLHTLMNPLTRWLSYRNLDDRVGRDTLSLILDLHQVIGSKADSVTVPTLIDALVTENVTMRGEIQDTLKSLWSLGYTPPSDESGLPKWAPSKDDKPSEILKRIEAYHEWWSKQHKRA
jgi:hypothetical protein